MYSDLEKDKFQEISYKLKIQSSSSKRKGETLWLPLVVHSVIILQQLHVPYKLQNIKAVGIIKR